MQATASWETASITLPTGMSVGGFFIHDECGRAQRTVGSATSAQMVPGCIDRQAEQAMGSKTVFLYGLCFSFYLQAPALTFSHDRLFI